MEEIPDSHLVAALAREFEREHAGFDVAGRHHALRLHARSHPGVDPRSGPPNGIVIFDNPWTSDFARGGLLRPIDDLLAETPELEWDDFAPALRDAAVLDGQHVGRPVLHVVVRPHLPHRSLRAGGPASATEPGRAGRERRGAHHRRPGGHRHAAEARLQRSRGVRELPLRGRRRRCRTRAERVVLDSPEARTALEAYADVYRSSAPPGTESWTFEDSIAALADGRARPR